MGQLEIREVKHERRLFSMESLHLMAKQRTWKSDALPDYMGVSNIHLGRWVNRIQARYLISDGVGLMDHGISHRQNSFFIIFGSRDLQIQDLGISYNFYQVKLKTISQYSCYQSLFKVFIYYKQYIASNLNPMS
jgi:hypothetical protein